MNNKVAVISSRQKKITEAIFTAQEKERAEIGKELYDNLGQILAASKLYLQSAVQAKQNKEEYIHKSIENIKTVLVEIRRIARTLIVPDGQIIGLFDNIRNMTMDFTSIHGIHIDCFTTGISEKELSQPLQITIFRIVQEQLKNVLAHSSASIATIGVSRCGDDIALVISDNGKGCNMTKKPDGTGLLTIKTRAEIFQGHVTILSKPGQGFSLKALFPLLAGTKA